MFPFLLIFFLLMLAYGWLFYWYQRHWDTIPPTDITEREPATPITLIIPARNEAANLGRLFDSILAQRYPRTLLEVLIIDDHSTDETASMIKSIAMVHDHIKYIDLKAFDKEENHTAYKKKAIATGISLSKGKLIVTTDADCWFGPDWLRTLAIFHEDHQASFIAAPVQIDSGKSILSKFQSIDFMTMQGITGAAVQGKFHSMCNGANLAYTREAYEEVNGFEGIDHIPSGDDMLLMHKIYKRYPEKVFYLKNDRAIVHTLAQPTWSSFLQQRIRWASKSTHYDDKRITAVLLLVYLVNVSFVVAMIVSLFNSKMAFFTLLLLLAKILIEFPFVQTVANFFKQHSLLLYHILLQPVHICYMVLAGWLGKFGSYEWKGRWIKK